MSIYIGLFFTSFTALSLEIVLVRLLSVTTWYHLAFFTISTAMLGMTAGAVNVYLNPQKYYPDMIFKELGKLSILFSLSIPITLVILCFIPINFFQNFMTFAILFIATFVCALPFYFAGSIISITLTKTKEPIGKLYASDLIGASLGCLFVLGGLNIFDASSLILFSSAIAAFSGVFFLSTNDLKNRRRMNLAIFLLLLVLGFMNSFDNRGIRPLIVKGYKIEPSQRYYYEEWNSFSRVAVYPPIYSRPRYWGPSPLSPIDPIYQYVMNIDGEAGTVMNYFEKLEDIEHLRYDVTNIGYYISKKMDACIIGLGGGRDVQSAILFGHENITGIDINPIFTKLLKGKFCDFAGIANYPNVNLVTAEARSYLSNNKNKYSFIQMSLIDTWAATGVGAFTLSENTLYTVEAWILFLNRLNEHGIFTVSRWYNPNEIGETGRMLSLAVASLFQMGIQEPSDHLALITANKIATLLISRNPFNKDDLDSLQQICHQLKFNIACFPNTISNDSLIMNILNSNSIKELKRNIEYTELNCNPPKDENPYFFNMLRLRHFNKAFSKQYGVVRGNLIATVTLIGLLFILSILSICTIIIPIFIKRKHLSGTLTKFSSTIRAGILYFILIGAGFMLTEIALIQRLSILLSHPIYALGILLFTLILSAGIGSFLSEKLALTQKPYIYIYPIATVLSIITLRYGLNIVLAHFMMDTLLTKIGVSIAVIFPIGILLGLFFPTGMKISQLISSVETPWYFAINGIIGVLCSVLAVFISIYISISVNFYIAALCYALTLVPLNIFIKQFN